MNSRNNRALLAALALCSLVGCSKDTAIAADAPASAKPASATPAGPTSDPCAVITDSEVRKSFTGAKSGKRDHSLDQYEIATCAWDTPTNMVVAQLFKAEGTVADELRSRASGVIDPLKPGAGKNFRYEKVAGIGDETMVVAEQGDNAQGVFNDVAVLVTRRGETIAVLFAHSLIDGDRDATLKALQALGTRAAARL